MTWAIVDLEEFRTQSWFLTNLKECLGTEARKGFTFMYEWQKVLFVNGLLLLSSFYYVVGLYSQFLFLGTYKGSRWCFWSKYKVLFLKQKSKAYKSKLSWVEVLNLMVNVSSESASSIQDTRLLWMVCVTWVHIKRMNSCVWLLVCGIQMGVIMWRVFMKNYGC